MENLGGLYRGIVEDDQDPQKRLRYRVRVYTVHSPDPHKLPTANLPWAEIGTLWSTHNAGMFPSYRIGERVWVAFEGGTQDLPVIMGGWIAAPNKNDDIPLEMQEKYPAKGVSPQEQTCQRMIFRDRKGNSVEWSEMPNENWVRMRCGDVQIKITQNDKVIHLETPKGVIQMVAKKVQTDCVECCHEAKKVTHQASGTATGEGCNLQLGSMEATTHGDQLTNNGGYTSVYKGTLYNIYQSLRSWIRAKVIDIGVATGTTDQGAAVPTTDSVNSYATQLITNDSEDKSSYQARNGILIATHKNGVHAVEHAPGGGDISVHSTHDVKIASDNDIDSYAQDIATFRAVKQVTIESETDVVHVFAQGDIQVISNAGGILIKAPQQITIQSDTKVKIQAPSVEISS